MLACGHYGSLLGSNHTRCGAQQVHPDVMVYRALNKVTPPVKTRGSFNSPFSDVLQYTWHSCPKVLTFVVSVLPAVSVLPGLHDQALTWSPKFLASILSTIAIAYPTPVCQFWQGFRSQGCSIHIFIVCFIVVYVNMFVSIYLYSISIFPKHPKTVWPHWRSSDDKSKMPGAQPRWAE